MANYAILVTDNGNGSFTLTSVIRDPGTNPSGGTSLLTNTYSQNAATGALTSASGFLDTATTTTDGLGHVLRNPMEAIERGSEIIRNDRSYNG
jgi:hypothetical protein